ncbi:MAG TPA: TlpA family protein disulfide reductase [Candidatus Jorgensenbacteria bacterium]|nr:TlpA family protein disulfide reductase [Candidatus Jorgensenbacteria bacterium]
MQRNIIIGIGVIIIAGVLFFVLPNRNIETDTIQSDFERLTHISLISYEGNTVSLAEFKGRPVVINSWAVWCPFCREELSDFSGLQKEFGDRITVIAIDRQEPLEKVKGYTDELDITNDMVFLLDPSDSFYKSIGGFSMPETIFVNEDGDIVVHKRGPMDLNEMREHTEKIISINEASL